jgi:CPA2 family monovalent cation:H+ antiporter-2
LHHVHELAPGLPVIVRSQDDTDLDKLIAAGASEVVPEVLEGSLMLASHALITLGVPLRRVVHLVQTARGERYESLRGYFHGSGDFSEADEHLQVRLSLVTLSGDAYANGKSLATLALNDFDVEVTIVRRGKSRLELNGDTVLQAGDIVVLRGSAEGNARAEHRLLIKN